MKQYKITYNNGQFETSVLVWAEDVDAAHDEFVGIYGEEPVSIIETGIVK